MMNSRSSSGTISAERTDSEGVFARHTPARAPPAFLPVRLEEPAPPARVEVAPVTFRQALEELVGVAQLFFAPLELRRADVLVEREQPAGLERRARLGEQPLELAHVGEGHRAEGG